jgi:hypothetical protein
MDSINGQFRELPAASLTFKITNGEEGGCATNTKQTAVWIYFSKENFRDE